MHRALQNARDVIDQRVVNSAARDIDDTMAAGLENTNLGPSRAATGVAVSAARGKKLRIPTETRLDFVLRSPLGIN